jgi:acetyl-CoA acetyltransferase
MTAMQPPILVLVPGTPAARLGDGRSTIVHVVGARPNFVKMAPVITALERRGVFRQVVVHTGQHYDTRMSDDVLADLDFPDIDIFLGVGSGTHGVQTAKVLSAFEKVLIDTEPDVVLVAGDVFDSGDFRRLADAYNRATRDHLARIPAGGPNALFALLTQRHMAGHDLGRDVYGRVAVAQRAWAALNDNAVFREPLTLEEYLAAPPVADPLCLLDCPPVVSGADAVVVTADDRATRSAVAVRALVTSFNADGQEGNGLRTGLADRAAQLWSAAAVDPADVDVLSVYDDYPAMVLVQLADLGLVEDGDLRRFVETRVATRDLALNTSGGQLSAGQAGAAGGMHGLVEIARQLRGQAGARQLQGAELGLVTGYGGVAYRYGACAAAAVLARVS